MSDSIAADQTELPNLENLIEDHEYLKVYRAPPISHIETIRSGLSASVLKRMATDMEMTHERLYVTLALARATFGRKLKNAAKMSSDESERALDLADLIGQVEDMIQRSGRSEGFDAAKWVARWLEQPLPALGGKRPAEWMDTARGRQLVSDTIARMQSGAYA